jgi:hypothetical protein
MVGTAQAPLPTLRSSLKFFKSSQPADNPSRKHLGGLNPAFIASGASSLQKEDRSMPISKYFAVTASALLAFLFITDAYFGDAASSRFDASLYDSALYAPRQEEVVATRELRFPRDVTPAHRVREVFAQFVPSEARRGKRYSAIATFVR